MAAISDLDGAIERIIKSESQCAVYKRQLADNKELLEMYSNMLGDYDDETLSDERKAELKALVNKWQKEDDSE